MDNMIPEITDRFGRCLKKTGGKPTVKQALYSWYLVNELINVGYLHNYQHERNDIVRFGNKVGMILDKALKIKAMGDGSNEQRAAQGAEEGAEGTGQATGI